METEIRISQSEYRSLYNDAKRNNKEIDRKAYKIAQRLNKIDVSIEIEGRYGTEELRACIDGNIDSYCLKSLDYRQMPSDLRDLINRFYKQLNRDIHKKVQPYYNKISDLKTHNIKLFIVGVCLGITNIITLLILLLKQSIK